MNHFEGTALFKGIFNWILILQVYPLLGRKEKKICLKTRPSPPPPVHPTPQGVVHPRLLRQAAHHRAALQRGAGAARLAQDHCGGPYVLMPVGWRPGSRRTGRCGGRQHIPLKPAARPQSPASSSNRARRRERALHSPHHHHHHCAAGS